MAFIEFKNIDISFDDKLVIQNFNLSIEKGDKILITGRSGCGKSSILKLLLGFVKPIKGQIFFKEEVINSSNVWELRKETSYVSQDMDIGGGSIKDYLKSIFDLKANKDLNVSENKLIDTLNYFNLNKAILNKNIEELSGGEKQRLIIVISILLDRRIVLLDEITSALDEDIKKVVIDYFLNKEDKTSIIIAHDKEWKSHNNLKIININEYGCN